VRILRSLTWCPGPAKNAPMATAAAHGGAAQSLCSDSMPARRSSQDWSRPLPRPLVIPSVMTLRTLGDVRELMRHLPTEHRSRPTWRHVAAELDKAAASADTADVSTALRMVLMLEKVEFRVA
jgi:hypothetical protein